MTPSTAIKRLVVIIVCVLATIYGVDYLWLQLRLESKDPNSAMDSVTRYDATTLKNGKVQIFFGQPEIQRCVHSLLPHLGYTPCWYLKRAGQDIKQISFFVAPAIGAVGGKRDSSSLRSSE